MTSKEIGAEEDKEKVRSKKEIDKRRYRVSSKSKKTIKDREDIKR